MCVFELLRAEPVIPLCACASFIVPRAHTPDEVRTRWGLAREIGNLVSKMAGEISDVNLMESPPDKVVLVGDVGVGKTSLFMRFKTGHFVEGTTHNPREGEFRKKWTINGNEVSVSFNSP